MKKGLQIGLALLLAGAGTNVTAQNLYELRQNSVSNVQLQLTNYGIYGLNTASNTGGGFWPRGSQNQYIFGGGIWFGALKTVDGTEQKLTFVTYNPNSGNSWAVPGRIDDGLSVDTLSPAKYALQSSVDYNLDGSPKQATARRWSMWNKGSALRVNGNYGVYESIESERSSVVYSKGPAFVSDEDMIAVFKDTDRSRYELGRTGQERFGFPLGIQFEQAMYSWNSPLLKDVIVMRYTMINTSQDVLKDCYFAPALDADLAKAGNVHQGAMNDRTKYLLERPDLQTAIQWTEETAGENDFGVLAVSLIETPATDANHNLRKDKKSYNFNEQLGLHTFRNWTIDIDPISTEQRYEFMSSGLKDGDNGPGDKRFLSSTGPFTMQPGDTAHVAIALSFSKRVIGKSSLKGDQITAQDDYTELITKIEAARTELYPELVSSVEQQKIFKERTAFISIRNNEATLHFNDSSFKNIRAELFNALGERMIVIHNGEVASGEISFTTRELPAGMYYCVITTDNERFTLPITIVR
ncbi:MAG TPA: hypothetical protein VEC36_11385 [Patescibacteria group bacterium]|nr:hypothetical protein [Patescibacteria group bacterium]